MKVSRAFAIPVKLQPGLNAICQKVTVDSGVLARTWALERNEGNQPSAIEARIRRLLGRFCRDDVHWEE